ncbi:MAG: hypothetical protein A2W26_08925 [Acidobacteria bacterium RBG_16_64_8]|nr:MAG: hypothetical protein A2W26_08925 [Acidobacteria bacterium RBG_16_64_8]
MPFADVPLGEWYAKWVKALWDDGFTAGCATDPLSFCPGQGHTRGEAAVFFVRLLRGKDYQPTETASLPYVDVPQGAWYRKWVGAAYAAGIVQGCEDDANRGDDRYRPQEGITRAEAACMLAKAKDLPPGPTPTPTITPTPTPRPTQPPGEGHTYPRSAVFTWCCGSAEYYAMFDLVISRKEDAGVIAQAKQLNPNLLWLPTHDLNTFLDHYPELPGEWALVDSQGNTITLGGFYGGDAFSDLSDLGVRVNGQRLIDRIPEVLAQLVAETGADGVASDGLYYRGHISWYMWDDVDLDRNGVNDLTEHGKDWVVTHWGNGVDLMLNKLRDLLGPDKLIVINTGSADLPTAGAINGLYLEHASSGWDGYTRDLFSSYFARVFQPPVFVLNYYVDPRDPQSPSRTYEHFQYMRFGLARALLEGDYYDFNAFESGEHYFSEYFDEFDLDVGYPRGRAVEIAPEVWARIFDRGAVIGNLNDHPVALSEAQLRAAPGYSGPYWRFQGCQDAAVNNGQPFDSVTLKGHSYIGYGDSGEVVGDGILLVSQPTTACPEIPRPEGGYWRDGR